MSDEYLMIRNFEKSIQNFIDKIDLEFFTN